jgi:hypothetical protein
MFSVKRVINVSGVFYQICEWQMRQILVWLCLHDASSDLWDA